MGNKIVFETPWFNIQATEDHPPHYLIAQADFVVVVATDPEGRLLLVRQFRPAVMQMTLELPAGHVNPGETPEQSARKELLEETGYEAPEFELLGTLSPSTARFTNRMWCFFAQAARLSPDHEKQLEAGLQPILYDHGLTRLLAEPEFFSAASHAALLRAVWRGRLRF